MLHDGYETVGTNSRVDLYSDSTLSCTPELLDLEVLFEPLEEQLYLASILVEVGNLLGSQFHGIGQEHELTVLLLIMEPNEPQMLRITFLTTVDGQFNLCISEYSFGLLRFQLTHLYCKFVLARTTKKDSIRCIR